MLACITLSHNMPSPQIAYISIL